MYQITQLITDLSRSRGQYLTNRVLPYALKSCHAMDLSLICRQSGISQDSLARQRQTDKSSIARQVAFLEEEGYITRCACQEDKRIMRLYPTEKAIALLPELTRILTHWEDRLTQDLTEEERALLLCMLKKMEQHTCQWKEEM